MGRSQFTVDRFSVVAAHRARYTPPRLAACSPLPPLGLAAHLSTKRSALERLDRYRLRLRKAEEDLHHKEDKRRVVADTLKKANAEDKSLIGENKSLRTDLEVANKRAAKRECQLAAAEEKIKSLGPPNGNANLLRLRTLLPKLWRQRRSPPSKPATLFGWLSMSSGHVRRTLVRTILEERNIPNEILLLRSDLTCNQL
uniref:Uncharacterized protein n=1 Tax=Oryza rufipogon TaxID=4529 RepID=A0A0E0P6H7_ORYRU